MTTETPTQLERMIPAYMKIRESRSDLKRTYEEADGALKRQLSIIEVALLKIMNDTGTSQLKIPGVGMAVMGTTVRVNGKDWSAIWKFIEETGNLQFLQRRLASRVIQNYISENDGEIPPGVELSTERTVSVRTA